MKTRYHTLRVALASGLLAAALQAQPPAAPELPPAAEPVAPFKTRTDKIPEVTEANEALEKALEKIAAAKGFDPAKTNQEFEILLKPGDTNLKDLRGIKFDPAKGFEPVYVSGGPPPPGAISQSPGNLEFEVATLKLQVAQLDKKLKESEAVQKTLLELIASIRKQLPSKPAPGN